MDYVKNSNQNEICVNKKYQGLQKSLIWREYHFAW